MAQTQISINAGFLAVQSYKNDTLGTPKGNGIKFTVYTDETKVTPMDLSTNTIICQVKKKASNRTYKIGFDSETPNGTSIEMTNAANGEFTLLMTAEHSSGIAAFPKDPDNDDPYVFDIQIATARAEKITQSDISAAVTTNIFNRATGSWVSDGFSDAVKVKVGGFTDPANNGIFDVSSVTATDITVTQSLVTEAIGPSITIEMVSPETRDVFTYIEGTWVNIQDVSGAVI